MAVGWSSGRAHKAWEVRRNREHHLPGGRRAAAMCRWQLIRQRPQPRFRADRSRAGLGPSQPAEALLAEGCDPVRRVAFKVGP